MEKKDIKIKLDGKERIVNLGFVNMGVRMRAIKESTEMVMSGTGFVKETDFDKAEVLEMIYSQEGDKPLTYKEYLTLRPKQGGDLLINKYRLMNYGGDSERDNFQENSME